MRKKHQSLRIFKSDLLEFFTHVHPITPLLIWAPVAAWLIWRSSAVLGLMPGAIGAWLFFGFLSWTFTEYVMHRFIFHVKPRTKVHARFQFLIHGLHHDDPNDPTRLVMPPLPAVIFAVVLYAAFRALWGDVFVEPYFAGFLIGYLCYDYIHFAIHHFRPRTKVGKFLKQYHMDHHFVNSETRWGVSSPLWDYVFGTVERPSRRERQAG